MEFGVCLPYMKRDYDRNAILSFSRKADEGAFASLQCGERIIGPTCEMRVLLAAAAAVTERVRIVPSLYVLPMHDAVWAAKEIATLDVVSGGRVTLTVGVGGREHDYRAVGADFSNRYRRMDEQVAQMRQTWAGESPFEGCDEIGPRPVQSGGPPIMAGVMGPKAMRRAAQWADGVYVFSLNGDGEDAKRMLDMADSAWREAGRDRPPIKWAGFWYSLAPDAESRLRKYVYEYLRVAGEKIATAVAGSMTRFTPDSVRESIEAFKALNVDQIVFVPATADLAELDGAESLIAGA
jgi:alkanesulfonate monooxygenase SsuD/methylene tetrahydromethanopterin reductase-like flavin-dependent oxidoreductase (luciferase family)